MNYGNNHISPSKTPPTWPFANRFFSTLLIIVAFGIIGIGSVLQMRLGQIEYQPMAIASLATEKHMANSVKEAVNALINTNDEIGFGERLQDMNRASKEWTLAHAALREATESGNLPQVVADRVRRYVLPANASTVAATKKLVTALEDADGVMSIEAIKPYISEVREKIDDYLFRLDHLDLMLANHTQDKIGSMRKLEGIIVVGTGIVLLFAGFGLLFPAQRKIQQLLAMQRESAAAIQMQADDLAAMKKLVDGRLRVALDTARMGTFIWHQKSDELEWDKNLALLYGLESSDEVKSTAQFLQHVHNDDNIKVQNHLERTLKNGCDTVEFRIKTPHGVRWLRNCARLLDGSNGTVVGASIDETDLMNRIEDAHESRKLAESANIVKSKFIANMSHDLRTPLTAILGFTQLLANDQSIAKVANRKYIKLILKNGNQLLSYVERLLEVTDIESGQLSKRQVQFSLRGLLAQLESSYANIALENKVILNTVLPDWVPERCLGNRDIIRIILEQLLDNAIGVAGGGHVKISLSLVRQKHRGDEKPMFDAEFRVIDTGPGVPPARHREIFEPFTPRVNEPGGTKSSGIGLYTGSKMSAFIGGSLRLEQSVEGEGSVFLLTIPVTLLDVKNDGDEENIHSERQKFKIAEKNYNQRLSVLIVEDNKSMQFLLSTILRDADIKPKIIEDGEQALEILRDNSFDVILMDISLPGIDGIEVTRRLRAQNYKGTIAAVSAHAFEAELERAMKNGCDRYFTKPINTEKLLDFLIKEKQNLHAMHSE